MTATTGVMYLQDILLECSAPEKFSKPTKGSEESSVLIVDFGSWQCRVGWSHETEPSMVFDSIVHRWKDENNLALVKIGRGIPTGSNVRATSRSAFEAGLPVHTPTIELIFDFLLKNYVSATGISLIITEKPLVPPYCRQEMMELLFEGYEGIERVAFVLDGPAVLPVEIPTALIIHIGASNTHIYPIIEGEIDWNQVKRINWGGVIAAEFLLKILGLKYPGILNSTNPNRLTQTQSQAIWQKCSLVAADISTYEREQEALSFTDSSSNLDNLNCCIRMTGDAASEADRRKAVAEAKKAAELNQAALQEKRRILADKLRQKSEEQREAKLRSKEHIYKALQGLLERVQGSLKKSERKKEKKEDEDILMEFSDSDDDSDAEDYSGNLMEFNAQNLGDVKLFEELKRLGFKNLTGLQEGLRRAEEDFFRLSGQTITTIPTDFSLLSVPDSELTEAEIREKRRLRLIKSSADARERQKAEKAAEDARKQAAAEALEFKRLNDLEGWRKEIYGKRREIIDKLVRRQKQRADRKGAAQGSRFRSVVALGGAGESDEREGNSGGSGGGSASGSGSNAIPDSGPDDGFGLNDDDWLVYRQVSRDDEEDSDLQDQETLSQIEGLLEEKDHFEFMKVLQEEQYASLTLLDRLTFGGEDAEMISNSGQPTINVNSERMRCTEGLFQPQSIQGIDQAGLIECLTNLFSSGSSYSKSIQSQLIKNVYISGGPANLPGLKERISNDLSSILPEDLVPDLDIKVCGDLEAAWKGTREKYLKVSKKGFNWISKSEYFENKSEEIPVIQNKNSNKNNKNSKKSAVTSESTTNLMFKLQNINDKKYSNPY